MSFKKIIKHSKGYREFKGEPFVKITRCGKTMQMHFNVWASRMFGLHISKVDVFIDEDKNEILISPNNESGEYSFVAPKDLDNRIVAFDSIYSSNPDIDTNRRYLVVKCDEGMKFNFERIPDYMNKEGVKNELDG